MSGIVPESNEGMLFKDRVTIVSGAASGIGRALCEDLAQRGAIVVGADIKFTGAGHLDVRDAAAIQQLVDETVRTHGRLDFMFNNAGIGVSGEVRDLTLDQWRAVIDTNLIGVIYGTWAAYRAMLEQRSGHIVNIGSLAGLIFPPGLAPYNTAKAGVVALSAALRIEAKAYGVRVSAVCPGFVDTAIFENAIGVKPDKRELLKAIRLPVLPVQDAARAILRGVERNQGTIVFPASARVLWRLMRINPALLKPIWRGTLEQLRKRRRAGGQSETRNLQR
jgi:NAD(P)-dependent dehydrogenase (short-subunit alcohol dehydrogenase family)